MEQHHETTGSRRTAARQAYYWALLAEDLRDHDRTEARRVSNTIPELATEWQQWAARVPQQTTGQQALDLAVMWARVAAVQDEEQQ